MRGDIAWFKNGTKPEEYIYHRTDGPAIEYANGDKEWYINGEYYSEENYNRVIKLKAYL